MKRILVYYGWPSAINNAPHWMFAPAEFGKYDHVVLGDGLQKPAHPDHERTVGIISRLPQSTTVYGYIDLGVTTQNLSLRSIAWAITLWRGLGARGIFFDDAGQDFGVDSGRSTSAVSLAREMGMRSCLNCWNPDDLICHPDFYLAESWAVADSNRTHYRARGRAILRQQKRLGFKVWAVATGVYSPRLMRRAYQAAERFGFDAFGWGEPGYSADSVAPYRPRPGEQA